MANNSQEITYFQPGQVVFHVSGKWRSQIETLLDTWVRKNISNWMGNLSKKISTAYVNNGKLYSVVTLKIVRFDHTDKPFTLASYPLDQVVTNLDLDLLLNLVILINGFCNKFNKELRAQGIIDAALQAVSPNWLMSGGSQPGATGGPGGVPEPFLKPGLGAQINLADPGVWEDITDPDGRHLFNFDSTLRGENVVIAVLDTAPPPVMEVGVIYGQRVAEHEKKHPLIESLCDPSNPHFFIHRNPNLEMPSQAVRTFNAQTLQNDPPPGFLQEEEHKNYKMTDHGIFAAGIIHSIAPEAEIHLYQVLNPYGVGDLLSVTDGLNAFYGQFSNSGKQLVVNLSLTLNLPLDIGHLFKDSEGVIDELGMQILKNRPCIFVTQLCRILKRIFGWSILFWFDRQAQPLMEICDKINNEGVCVIAAAGNDCKDGQSHPPARYPAAFESVLGVGALPRIDPKSIPEPVPTASYSNLADTPPEAGIVTLGGEKGSSQGILGTYIGEFPPNSTPSLNGWAWWCGTSFATPIISGLVAAAFPSILPLPNTGDNNAKKVVNQLVNVQTVKLGRRLVTAQKEDALLVLQGP